MKISHRLYLAVAPAVLAVLLLAGLMYWGQYARVAPDSIIVGGAVVVIALLVVTWSNARYVARRLERIVGAPTAHGGHTPSLRGVASAIAPGATLGPPDEIDEIERVVDRLSSAVELAEGKSSDRERRFERRAQDYALLLASIADASTRRLEEVRLPLHILLENHFGDLNENQEEMLGAARTAAEAADADMLALRQIAALDLGERPLRDDRLKPAEIIDALRPMLRATAEKGAITIEFDVAPLLPAVAGDRALLQGALVTVLRDAVASAGRESRVVIEVEGKGPSIVLAARGGGMPVVTVRWAAAVRVIQAHGGSVARTEREVAVELPTGRVA